MRASNSNGTNPWVQFFFGSPRRFLYTVLGALVLFIFFFPGLGWEFVGRVLERASYAFGPVIGMILPFVIVGWGFWFLLGMPGRKKKEKKKH